MNLCFNTIALIALLMLCKALTVLALCLGYLHAPGWLGKPLLRGVWHLSARAGRIAARIDPAKGKLIQNAAGYLLKRFPL